MNVSNQFTVINRGALGAVLALGLFASTSLADPFDPGDDTIGGAVRLTQPSSIPTVVQPERTLRFASSNGIIDTADYFIIALTAGKQYNFNSNHPSSNGDPVLEILSADTGQLVGTSEDGTGFLGLQFTLDLTPQTTGDYYLKVTPYNEVTPAFTYVMSYSEVTADDSTGDSVKGDGGNTFTAGGTGISHTAPFDFVTITDPSPLSPDSLKPNLSDPKISITSQISAGATGNILLVSGIAVPGINEPDDATAARTSIPIELVEYRARNGNQEWSEWTAATGTEEWSFQTNVAGDKFVLFQVRATDANGSIAQTMGVEQKLSIDQPSLTIELPTL